MSLEKQAREIADAIVSLGGANSMIFVTEKEICKKTNGMSHGMFFYAKKKLQEDGCLACGKLGRLNGYQILRLPDDDENEDEVEEPSSASVETGWNVTPIHALRSKHLTVNQNTCNQHAEDILTVPEGLYTLNTVREANAEASQLPLRLFLRKQRPQKSGVVIPWKVACSSTN